MTFHFTKVLNANWSLTESKGEGQQSLMIRDILQYLFPKASFRAADAHRDPLEVSIELQAIDFGEFGLSTKSAFEQKTLLEMPMLKAGNPQKNRVGKSQAKNLLGLKGKTVVHLYSAWTSTLTPENAKTLFDSLQRAYGNHFLILSFGNGSSVPKVAAVFSKQFGHGKANVHKLSELTTETLGKETFGLILNDTVGNMPFLYSASDLALVAGPVNFFQPLAQGTKTAFIFPPDDIRITRQYEPQVIEQLVSVGNQAGGFLKIESFENLDASLRKLEKMPAPIHPAFAKINGTTAFYKILDRILEILKLHRVDEEL